MYRRIQGRVFHKYLEGRYQYCEGTPTWYKTSGCGSNWQPVLAKEATVAEYIKNVLPLLLKNRVVHVLGYANRLGFDPMPSDIQICPSCKESLGEDAIRMVQNSSFPISQQGIWNPRRNGASHVHWELHDKKDASWEPNKHEPVPDSISPASRDNVYLPSLNDILSDDEDTISNASDVVVAENTSIAKRLYWSWSI